MLKKLIIVILCVCIINVQIIASAFFGGIDPDKEPSVINYGWSGLVTGTLLGAAIGGLQAIDQSETLSDSDKARKVINGSLYGLIGGTGVGLVIGFHDLSHGKTGIGGIILRDMYMGGLLGLVVGSAVGGIQYSDSNKGNDFARSALWGYITGTGLGLIFGIIEGPKIVGEKHSKNNFIDNIKLSFIPNSQGSLCPYVQFQYCY